MKELKGRGGNNSLNLMSQYRPCTPDKYRIAVKVF